TVASVIGNSAWVAWMGDLVPDRLRGSFFGRRTVFLSIAGTLTSLGAAILLDRLAPIGWTGAALSVLTAAAFLAGVVSIVLMLRQHEPPVPAEPGVPGWQALRLALRDRRVRPFLGYLFAWNAAVRIASARFWGLAVDRIGAGPVVVFCSFGIAAVPLTWFVVTPDRLWPIALD